MKKSIIVIGSGFSGLASASFLAKEGHEVTLLEKNDSLGGRARQFSTEGFVFDMGPSWYWMPDVFDRYFDCFGKKVSDYYDLVHLDPSYKVVWGKEDAWDIPANYEKLKALFEKYEKGAGEQLDRFIQDAAYKYEVGMNKLVHVASANPLAYLSKEVVTGVFKLQLFSSFREHAQKYFSHPKILGIIEFPVLFLGETAQKIPALYSLMNYADIKLGTHYPMGGMHKIIEGMVSLAQELGVNIKTSSEVKELKFKGKRIEEVVTATGNYKADYVMNTADYHHFETQILPDEFRAYDEAYWDKKTMAPSCLLFYLGFNKRIPNLSHHNLFFDESLDEHSKEIYEDPKWPTSPLFYTCVPSVTDSSVAPEGYENVFLLMPIASDLKDDEATHEYYFDYMIKKMEVFTGEQNLKENIVYKRSFSGIDFKNSYHAYKGNAYGLANTLDQTAFLRPRIRSKKVQNLFHAGQLTLPGPGMPPSLISGEIAAKELINLIN